VSVPAEADQGGNDAGGATRVVRGIGSKPLERAYGRETEEVLRFEEKS